MAFGTGADPNVVNAAAAGATSGVISVSGPVCGVVSVSGTATIAGTVSISGTVTVGAHTVNQGTASVTAWPFYTSQAVSGAMSVSGPVSGVMSVSGPVSGVMSVSGAVSGVMSVSGAVSGVQSISGTVGVNQGAASAVAWPFYTSQVVSSVITGFVSVSNTVTVTGNVSVSGAALVTGLVSISNTVTVTGTVSTSGTVTVSGTANQGAASLTAWPMAISASNTAAQGASVFFNNVLTNVVSNVKTSSGVVYGYRFYNPNQTIPAFVQFYKITAASVGLSTAVGPLFTVLIPSAAALVRDYAVPVGFASGIAIAATVSNSGSTANAIGIHAEVIFQ